MAAGHSQRGTPRLLRGQHGGGRGPVGGGPTGLGDRRHVSRGGRPDLAGARLAGVRSPTLLIVGGYDEVVLELNRQAQARLHSLSQLAVVAGATYLFEEPGALEEVGRLAADWFLCYLAPLVAPSVW